MVRSRQYWRERTIGVRRTQEVDAPVVQQSTRIASFLNLHVFSREKFRFTRSIFPDRAIFPREKACYNRNMESESEIFKYIESGKLALPPLSFKAVSRNLQLENGSEADLILESEWGSKTYKFVAEVKRYGSDKTVMEAARQASYLARLLRTNPLVIMPWLSEQQLLTLEREGISGVDLCGNGVINIPHELLIFRTGQPNRFPTSRLVKKVYQGTSSLVARVILLCREFGSVSAVLDEIALRGGNTTLATVSKALKQMEEDVIIEKTRDRIRLLQPDKLLDRLTTDYQPPKVVEQYRYKIWEDDSNIRVSLSRAFRESGQRLVLSGSSSTDFYATMAREPVDIYYCSDLPFPAWKDFAARMEADSRFPNFEFRKTDSELVFFDNRELQAGYRIASPVQTYLELASSDKRGREVAEQLRKKILSGDEFICWGSRK
jgi:hypothetical protein